MSIAEKLQVRTLHDKNVCQVFELLILNFIYIYVHYYVFIYYYYYPALGALNLSFY